LQNLRLSFDTSCFASSLGCASPSDAQTLRDLVTSHASHPNQFMYSGRAFVSTFAGETCNFGQGSPAQGWTSQFTQPLSGKIYFVPSFFVDPATFKDFAGVMDGDFNWNSGWPIQVTTQFAQNAVQEFSQAEQQNGSQGSNGSANARLTAPGAGGSLAANVASAVEAMLSKTQQALAQFIGSTDTDDQHISGLQALQSTVNKRDGEAAGKPAYMGAVSPWFFTHYGPDSFNKNFVFLSDQHLYSKRWDSLISQREKFDIVEVLTWNDYGESHYVGPIKGAQPNSQAWTDGMDHTAWLTLTKYYASAFKTGSYPAITQDSIVMWSRPHPTNAQAQADNVPPPTNFALFEDAVWAVVMAKEPATVVLSVNQDGSNSKTFDVPAGVSKLAIPISAGGRMQGVVQRGGKNVLELKPNFTFQGSPKTYNYNAFVAGATAD
jgi:glucan endo-1,3-alpha-glucosidase